MNVQSTSEIRELRTDEIDAIAGGVNPWIVRIAAKLIIAAIDHVVENGVDGGSIPRSERETGNKV
jgi:hypothetical protein